jgi:putative ATP-binding cassette transporter
MQQRYEADFRYNLVRVRENAEQIALLEGEKAEKQRLLERFGRLMSNWMLIMSRTKKVTFFTSGFAQISNVFPFVVGAPAYFAGSMQLGGLMQTASAFGSVQGALSYFVSSSVYRTLAEWLAVIDRLDGFEHVVAAGHAAAVATPAVKVQPQPEGGAVELASVEVSLPGGRPLVGADRVVLRQGQAVLFEGPTGAGKSTLFRAIAGIWPFGSGTVTVPKDAHVMTLPQRPYFPVGTLAAAIAYPAEPTAFSREQLTETLEAVGLSALAPRLDEEAHWNRMLSLGEQQRLGLARAILEKPDFLFLDEATASLDEPSEAKLYRLLHKRLPEAAIISIGHRSTLAAFHSKRFELEHDETHYRVREAAIKPAAE